MDENVGPHGGLPDLLHHTCRPKFGPAGFSNDI